MWSECSLWIGLITGELKVWAIWLAHFSLAANTSWRNGCLIFFDAYENWACPRLHSLNIYSSYTVDQIQCPSVGKEKEGMYPFFNYLNTICMTYSL